MDSQVTPQHCEEALQVSVIVPNYNGIAFVDTFVDSLITQVVADTTRYEILIVDNGSTDGSYERLVACTEAIPDCHVLRYTKRQSSYAARNYGAKKANGAYLAFTDIDCVLPPTWLASVCSMSAVEPTCVSGSIELFPRGKDFNAFEWFDAQFFLRQEEFEKKGVGATANLVVKKELFENLKGFAPVSSGGDGDFCRRLRTAGNQIVYRQDIAVRHPARSTYGEIAMKIKRVAKGKVETVAGASGADGGLLRLCAKSVIALVVQPQFWRVLKPTLAKHPLRVGWVLQVLGWSIVFCSLLRCTIIVHAGSALLARGERQ